GPLPLDLINSWGRRYLLSGSQFQDLPKRVALAALVWHLLDRDHLCESSGLLSLDLLASDCHLAGLVPGPGNPSPVLRLVPWSPPDLVRRGRDHIQRSALTAAPSRTLSNILLLFGIGAIAFGLLTIWFRRQKLAPVIFLPPFVLLICFLGLTGEVALQDYLSSASIASVIERNSDANTLIISEGDISDRTSLFFYLHRQLHWLDGIPAQEYAARKYGI